MRFLILGLNYVPESTSIGPYTADLAEHLRAAGHEVRVVTGFPMAPQWKVWEGYRGRWFMREELGGVPILRSFIYVPADPKRTLNRILFDCSFAFSALLGGIFQGPANLIIAVSPPLQLGVTAWLLARLKRAPFFLHLQDLVSDAAIATGRLSQDGLAARLARSMERFVYDRSAGIGVICDGFKRNLVAHNVPAEKIQVLPNSLDLEFIGIESKDNGFRLDNGIGADEFLVMYSGSIALKHGLTTFVDAAVEFAPEEGVVFSLVGEGPSRDDLLGRARGRNIGNLRFLPLQPRESLPAQLRAANVLAITQQKAVGDAVFPGKLLYYMAAGRPVLAAVGAESETGRFVRDHRVGLVVEPENPGALARAVRFLRDNPPEAAQMGKNGREVVERMFDRKVVLDVFRRHLESLARQDPGASLK
ncbi:MAG: WcaI family glycosyltransferase [Acidobacteriia bacterium]|nr:WcaI family glycosyltransferase [Terriglobia bacterium]